MVQTRQLVTVCECKLLANAVDVLASARPEYIASRHSPDSQDHGHVTLRNDQALMTARWSGGQTEDSPSGLCHGDDWVRLSINTHSICSQLHALVYLFHHLELCVSLFLSNPIVPCSLLPNPRVLCWLFCIT